MRSVMQRTMNRGVGSLLEIRNRTNETMQLLTVIATILSP